MIFHDTVNRTALIDQIQQARESSRKAADPTSIGTRRARPICLPPLSVPEGVPADLRNCREVRQADRALVLISRFRLPGGSASRATSRQWEELLRVGD